MRQTTTFQVNLNYYQILQIVKQLPVDDKIRLSKELEKDDINSKLTRLLKAFKTNELNDEIINRECESVREKLYNRI